MQVMVLLFWVHSLHKVFVHEDSKEKSSFELEKVLSLEKAVLRVVSDTIMSNSELLRSDIDFEFSFISSAIIG